MEIVLNTYGTSISRDNEGFLIKSVEGVRRIPVEGVSAIQISKGAQITSDAVLLAVEHEIEILFLDKSGKPFGRVWSHKYGSISTIRKGQLNFASSKDALIWIKNVIRQKIANQQAMLLSLISDDEVVRRMTRSSIDRLEDYRNKN